MTLWIKGIERDGKILYGMASNYWHEAVDYARLYAKQSSVDRFVVELIGGRHIPGSCFVRLALDKNPFADKTPVSYKEGWICVLKVDPTGGVESLWYEQHEIQLRD